MSKQRKKHPGVVAREKAYRICRRADNEHWSIKSPARWRKHFGQPRKRLFQLFYIVEGSLMSGSEGDN